MVKLIGIVEVNYGNPGLPSLPTFSFIFHVKFFTPFFREIFSSLSGDF